MTKTTEQILALAKTCGVMPRLTPVGTDEVWANKSNIEAFYHAAIQHYKDSVLKEVGEPVAYVDYGDRVAWNREKPVPETDLFTSDQVAAAILKATKPLEERICDLTACKWPDAYTVIPVKINGQLHATSQAINNEINSLRQQLAAAQEEIQKLRQDLLTSYGESEELSGQLAKAEQLWQVAQGRCASRQ